MDTEARYFQPTELCPHPERWHSTDGDSTEIEVSDLAWGLVRTLQPDYCVETGTGHGVRSNRPEDRRSPLGERQGTPGDSRPGSRTASPSVGDAEGL